MRHFIFLLFMFVTASNLTANNYAQQACAPDFIIIDDAIVYVTANAQLTAVSVRVELLDAHGNVQAATNTSAGSTVSFSLNNDSKSVRSTYMLTGGNFIIIVDVIE